MTSTEQQPRPMNRETITTIAQAFRVLGIVNGISKQSQINDAFRAKAKAAHRSGDYLGDMDALTQAKDILTKALIQAQEQAQRDQARTRAQAQEQEERERAQANQKKREQEASQQKEASTKSEAPTASEPLCLGPAKNQSWEAVRTYERQKAREREQTRRLWSYQDSQDQKRARQAQQLYDKKRGKTAAMQTDASSQGLTTPQSDDILQEALQLFQQRESELEHFRTQEDELKQALSRIQRQRAGLEQNIQTAHALANQLRTLLTQSGDTPAE